MMKLKSILTFFLLSTLAVGKLQAAVNYTTGPDPFGNTCDIVSWNDASARPRIVWIVHTSPGGFITRYTYYAGTTFVNAGTGTAYPPMGLLGLTNHWNPCCSGTYNWSFAAADLAVPLSASVVFQGANHLIWRGTLRMNSGGSAPFYNTIQYEFTNGRNDFTYSFTYDAGAMTQDSILADNHSPYGEFDYAGTGSSTDANSGVGWGTLWKFKTTSSPASHSSSWDYTQPNTIPYIWIWKDTTLSDRELGIVQNQPYKDQNAGGGLVGIYGCLPAPPSSGTGLPTNNGCLPYQLNSYEDFASSHFTWGSNYPIGWAPGSFGNNESVFHEGHGEAYGTYTYGVAQNGFEQYPVNAWSFNVLIDQWSVGGVQILVSDTESTYASALTALVGSVATMGPRGPGNYLAPGNGMPTVTYSTPGFDFITRAWTLQAAATGVDCALTVPAGKTVSRPTFIFKGMAGLPCSVLLNGISQTEGTDTFSSYDAATSQVYMTFNKDFLGGPNHLVVETLCGSPAPTLTSTPSSTLTPTPTTTPTSSTSSTSTATDSTPPTTTPTCTPSSTRTWKASSTPTDTNSVTSTPTHTATSTVSMTVTSSMTATATTADTLTQTPSRTPSGTPTASPTSTDSMTPTASLTVSWTSSPTLTAMASPSPTPTNTVALTVTPTVTATFTPSASFTSTAILTESSTPSFSSTFIPSPTSTTTWTPTPSLTATSTLTATLTATRTATASLTATLLLTPTSTPSGVVIGFPYPNPDDGSKPVSFRVETPAVSKVEWEVFTTAFRKITGGTGVVFGRASFGWDFRDKEGQAAANGLYYIRVQVGDSKPTVKILKVLLIR